MEFIRLCFAPATVPFTIMLGLVVLYWFMVILGAVGMDTLDVDMDMDADVDLDLDFDVDADVDVDFDVDADVDLDVDADVDADFDGDVDGDLEVAGTMPTWVWLLKFFNLGEVPLTILLSVMVFCLWSLSLILNAEWNVSQDVGMSLLLLIPNVFGSLLTTKILTAPFRPIFRRAKEGIARPVRIVGKRVFVTTGEVTESFGQAELCQHDDSKDGPITLNIRSR
ncbi:MAG: hypothetical protein AAF497_04520, partial [Planctomycetota bacterium]